MKNPAEKAMKIAGFRVSRPQLRLERRRYERTVEPRKPGGQTEDLVAELEAEGMETETWTLGAGGSWMGLSFDFDRLIILSEGEGQLLVGDHSFPLAEGDRMLIPAGSSFMMENRGQEPMSWVRGVRR